MRRRLLVGLGTAVLAATFVLLGGVFSGTHPTGRVEAAIAAARSSAQREDTLARLLSGLSSGDTQGYVRALERRVEADPHDPDALTLLGLAYQQRSRETGDPSFYALSGRALERAAREGGQRSVIVQGQASLANTRHRFQDGLKLARAAVRLDPESGSALGALGDALINLGRYRQAFAVYDRMARLTPGIASYARVASARELLGRPSAAGRALLAALEIDSNVPEHVAWTTVQLGNVYFNQGRLDAAAEQYRRALRRFPGYVHAAAGLARVEASKGRYRMATNRLRRVVAALAIPAYVILLGDVLHAAGREPEARRTYALVGAIERLFAANGVRTELQTAVFDLDHGRNVASALARARAAHRAAPGIQAEDALAWALYRAGQCAEARSHSARALRFGTRDALFLFHRAMIERCLGDPSAASSFRQALAVNPYFSFRWSPVARAIARDQGSSETRR